MYNVEAPSRQSDPTTPSALSLAAVQLVALTIAATVSWLFAAMITPAPIADPTNTWNATTSSLSAAAVAMS